MIYVLSGGGKKAVAAIGVTFPAGSTVTATADGQTPRTYDDTTAQTGKWFIPLAAGELGTWTVNCTDGTQSANPQAVSITVEGQVETVEIYYTLYILKAGVIQACGLGSTIKNSNYMLALTQNEGSITLKNNAAYASWGYRLTDTKIDLTQFTTLKCTGYQPSSNVLCFGLSTAIGPDATDSAWLGGTVFNTISTTRAFDVSTYTGEYYVGFGKPRGGMQPATVIDLWFE